VTRSDIIIFVLLLLNNS